MRIIASAILVAVLGAAAPQAGLKIDKEQKTVSVPCKIAPRKLPNLPEIYPIEVIATHPTPKGLKAHETVINFDVTPSEIHKALESLGLKPGKPGRGENLGSGPEVELLLELPAAGNQPARRIRFEQAMVERRTGKALPPLKWYFTGSAPKETKYGADVSGTLITLFPISDETVFQSSFTMLEEGLIKVETHKSVLPAEGTAATLIIKAGPGAAPPPPQAAAGNDPESQVVRLSRKVGPHAVAVPDAPVRAATTTATQADPFEHRREARPGKALVDSIRPVDARPAVQKN